MSTWVTIGHIGVDSGTVMVGDPCYVVPDDLWSDWCKEFEEKEHQHASEMEPGYFAVTTAHGDGSYPVEAKYDANGRVTEIRVKFI
jgi:hypothetical protein